MTEVLPRNFGTTKSTFAGTPTLIVEDDTGAGNAAATVLLAWLIGQGVILTDDGRLDDTRDPNGHATSHELGGTDVLDLDASQIGSGTLADGRIPAAITRDTELQSAVAAEAAARDAAITAQINALVSGSPGLLDTLNEIAAALGDDPNLVATLTALIATKVAKSDYNANTILAANVDDTPAPVTVAPSTLVGRAASGSIAGLSVAQVKTILALAAGDISGLGSAATKNVGTGAGTVADGAQFYATSLIASGAQAAIAAEIARATAAEDELSAAIAASSSSLIVAPFDAHPDYKDAAHWVLPDPALTGATGKGINDLIQSLSPLATPRMMGVVYAPGTLTIRDVPILGRTGISHKPLVPGTTTIKMDHATCRAAYLHIEGNVHGDQFTGFRVDGNFNAGVSNARQCLANLIWIDKRAFDDADFLDDAELVAALAQVSYQGPNYYGLPALIDGTPPGNPIDDTNPGGKRGGTNWDWNGVTYIPSVFPTGATSKTKIGQFVGGNFRSAAGATHRRVIMCADHSTGGSTPAGHSILIDDLELTSAADDSMPIVTMRHVADSFLQNFNLNKGGYAVEWDSGGGTISMGKGYFCTLGCYRFLSGVNASDLIAEDCGGVGVTVPSNSRLSSVYSNSNEVGFDFTGDNSEASSCRARNRSTTSGLTGLPNPGATQTIGARFTGARKGLAISAFNVTDNSPNHQTAGSHGAVDVVGGTEPKGDIRILDQNVPVIHTWDCHGAYAAI